jgi:hypothetical protein
MDTDKLIFSGIDFKFSGARVNRFGSRVFDYSIGLNKTWEQIGAELMIHELNEIAIEEVLRIQPEIEDFLSFNQKATLSHNLNALSLQQIENLANITRTYHKIKTLETLDHKTELSEIFLKILHEDHTKT